MKYADINKRYTEIVSEYMAAGYTLNTATMTGSQGEIAKIDLTDGKEIIRVLATNFHDWKGQNIYEGVGIIVGRANEGNRVTPNNERESATLWNNHLEVLRQERFYELGENRRSGKFYGTQAEAVAAWNTRLQRYKDKQANVKATLPAQALEVAKRIVRERFGVKRICEADVIIKKLDKGGYSVSYRNHACQLH